jgi:hypothetical protein
MIKIIDDAVPLNIQLAISKMCNDTYFPWYLQPTTVDMESTSEFVKEYLQFCHTFIRDNDSTSEYAEHIITFFNEICNRLDIPFLEIIRAKVNLQTQCNFSKETFFNTPHIDKDTSHKVAIYYINDSDGDTYFFDNNLNIIKTVTPKQGRFIFFDGSIKHAGRHPILAEKRLVLNFNYI